MDLFEPGTFHYLDNKLYCEHKAVLEIIEETGTPAYIYSKKYLVDSYKEFEEAFKGINHSIYYAVKSNFNVNIIKILGDLGCGMEVFSAGEFYRVKKAGISPHNVMLSGVGKLSEEIKTALEFDFKAIKAESLEELVIINKIAAEANTKAPVAIRVNPDVDAHTHPYISTGMAENKFGIDSSETEYVYKEAASMENILLTGIDMHIGSQITTVEPFVEAVKKLSAQFKQLRASGIPLKHFNIGGGMGIQYKDEKVFNAADLAKSINPILQDLDCEIIFEPGRYFTANAGILVTEVQYTKTHRSKNFVIVDAAMTELIRPALYDGYHIIQPVELKTKEEFTADIVGPVCESSDFLAQNRTIYKCERGDKLAVMSAGAYGMTMSSNYNGRRRVPEVIVNDNKFFTTRSRESFDHLLWDEEIVSELHS